MPCYFTVPRLRTWRWSHGSHSSETWTQYVVQPTQCINQLSKWYGELLRKKSRKLFRGRDLILMKLKPHVSLAGSSTNSLGCFTLLLARHLADVSCYIGPSMPCGICMEIHTGIVQKRKKKPSRDKGIPRQPHAYLKIDQSRRRLDQPITNPDRNILIGNQRTQ